MKNRASFKMSKGHIKQTGSIPVVAIIISGNMYYLTNIYQLDII